MRVSLGADRKEEIMADTQRLDKVLSNSGFGSRKDIKKMVRAGEVQVDGKIVKDSSMHTDPYQQEIVVSGQLLEYKAFVYLMMNKPAGVISATWDKYDKTVIDLVPMTYRHFELFPVGRLDKDAEGLLLITNDGKLSHQLLSPKKHVPKTYYVKIEGEVTVTDIDAFKQGVVLEDGYKTMPAALEILEADSQSKIHITIMEGKFHQVKRMFEAVGKKVIYLKRIRMGNLALDENLALGECKELNQSAIDRIIF